MQLAREVACAMTRDGAGMSDIVDIENFDLAVDNQEKIEMALPALEKRRATRYKLLLAVGGNARAHVAVQLRKSLIGAVISFVRAFVGAFFSAVLDIQRRLV